MTQSEIVSVLCDLYKITGFRMSLHNADFQEIAAYPQNPTPFCAYVHSLAGEFQKCKECDRLGSRAALEQGCSYSYHCRFGLTEVASPLYSFGILTGFLMMGQVIVGPQPCGESIRTILPEAQFREKLLSSVPTVAEDMLASYVRILTICAEYLTLSNALSATHQDLGAMTKKYIGQNFQKKITLNDICKHLACSKSTLVNTFRKTYGVTVTEYLTEVRLNEAEKLLRHREYSLAQIAALCGFSDQSYFSKVFATKMGCAPGDYRRRQNIEDTSHG
jgi:AraC-like DNA-binding protein